MGYEVERFVKQVDEHVICPLCKKVFKDPTNCTEGHTFCKVCIDQWLQTPENYKTCPKDQKVHVIDKQALSPNYALCGVINNLEVFCHIPHELKTVTSDPGAVQQTCDWTGKLQSLEKHRETCPFQQVKCPHVNCNEMMQRREREGHDKICKYKKVECEKCNKVFVRHVLQTHKDVECPEVLVPCPNGCTNPQGQNTEIKSQEVLQDPWGCKRGHAFCKDCIIEWLKINQTCPLDNKPLQVNDFVHYLIVRNTIDNLDVYCHPPENDRRTAASGEKCAWTGKLQSLAKHRETCPFQQVQCPHVNCKAMMQRRKLEDHDKVCEFKRVRCEKCNKILVRHVLQTHIDVECPEVLVPCPDGCTSPQGETSRIKRINLNHHLTNICAKTVVDCPYKNQGCSVQVKRQDVEKHRQAHMMSLVKSLRKENQALKDALKKVKAQLSSANTYTWVIYVFPVLCDKHPNGSRFRSPNFWLPGYKLSLSLYPNGINTDAFGFISLFLRIHEEYSDTSEKVTNVPNSESVLKFRLSIISQKPDIQDVSFIVTYIFKKSVGHGLHKFVKTTDALSADYCNNTNSSLTIKCTILLDKP